MVLKFSFAHFNISETTRHILSVKLGKQLPMCGKFIFIKNITFLYVLPIPFLNYKMYYTHLQGSAYS